MKRIGTCIVFVFLLGLVVTTDYTIARSNDALSMPNVIIITIDTARADHLSLYGYDRPTSPKIDALALQATKYENAISTASWTLPSHASLFTGKYPFEHGAHAVLVGDELTEYPLSQEEFTLTEAFKGAGYQTAAFVANAGYLSPRFQLDQGFDVYQADFKYGDQLNVDIFSWLKGRSTMKPFFLFVNYMDAHSPYNTTSQPTVVSEPVDRDNQVIFRMYERVMPATEPVPLDLSQKMIDQYDLGIANADQAVGSLINRLKRHGLFDNTIIVVTSDHGEYFGEHNFVEHRKHVYQEVVHVPLVIKGQGQIQSIVDSKPISLIDVAGIVLAELPVNTRAHFPVRGSHPILSESDYTGRQSFFHAVWGKRLRCTRVAIFEWPYKAILSSTGEHELYNLLVDPLEADNLADPQLISKMQDKVEPFIATRGKGSVPMELANESEHDREVLRALGYL